MRGRIVVFAGIVASGAACAEPVAMNNEAIKTAVDGATVEIDTPLGTTVPMRFASDGTVSGEAGKVAFFLGADRDHGKWWVARNLLCARWTVWFKGEISCMRLTRDGQKIAWQRSADLEEGTATLIPKAPVEPPVKAQRSALGGPLETPAPHANFAQANAAMTAPPLPDSPPVAVASVAAIPDFRAPAMTAPRLQPIPAPPIAAGPVPARPIPPAVSAAVQNTAKAPANRSKVAGMTPASPSFWVNGVARDDVLNMRREPSSEADIVGEIPADGHGVRIVGGCQEMWCLVSFDGAKGWVNRSYLMYELPNAAAAADRNGARKIFDRNFAGRDVAGRGVGGPRARASQLAREIDPED